MTVFGVIWKPKIEYTPTVTSRSCTIAIKGTIAIFGSKGIVMYATTAMKNTMSASRALFVICPPQVGPTLLVETWMGFAWAVFAMASTTWVVTAACWLRES